MDDLREYLNSLKPADQHRYAKRCGTTVGYLRKAVSVKQRISEGLCIELERESGGKVRCERLRDDVDWAYLRRRSVA